MQTLSSILFSLNMFLAILLLKLLNFTSPPLVRHVASAGIITTGGFTVLYNLTLVTLLYLLLLITSLHL